MKRTALKRTKGLKPISPKHKLELLHRAVLKAQLINAYGECCMTCKDRNRDFRGISLSHIIPLSRGGKTNRENCLLECYVCHDLYEKHPERREKCLQR